MKINELIDYLETYYDEIDVFDHIDSWTQETASGYETYALCTVTDQIHSLSIQDMVWLPESDDIALEYCPIYQIYISYTEDPQNKIRRAFRYNGDPKSKDSRALAHLVLIELHEDMGWVYPIEENPDPEEA